MNTIPRRFYGLFILLLLFFVAHPLLSQWEQLPAPDHFPPQYTSDPLMLRYHENGDARTIYRSVDRGRHWEAVYTYPEQQYFSAFLEADGHFYALSYNHLLASADQGATFQDFPNQPQASYRPKAVWHDTLLAVSLVQTKVRRYFPGGGFDDAPIGGTPTSYIQSLWRVGDRLFAWLKEGIYYSTDGGASWFPSAMPDLPSGNQYEGIIVPSGNRIFSVYNTYTTGNHSVLLRSNDMGETWLRDTSAFKDGQCRMVNLGANNAALFMWAASTSPPCTAADGSMGETWRLPHDSDVWESESFVFSGLPFDIESDSLLVSGNYHSTDNGMTWKAYPLPDYTNDMRNFFVWPDAPPIYHNDYGIFHRADSAAPFTLIEPDAGGLYGNYSAQRGDTVAWFYGNTMILTTNRGETLTHIPLPGSPIIPYHNTWGNDGLCVYAFRNVNGLTVRQLLKWSFETLDWTELPIPAGTKWAIVWNGVIYAVLENGFSGVMISTDWGNTWSQSLNGIDPSGQLWSLYALDDKVWVQGQTGNFQEITYITDNQGITWYAAEGFPGYTGSAGYAPSLFSANGQLFAVFGWSPYFVSSDDNGHHWYPVTDDPTDIGAPTRLAGDYIYTLGKGFRRRPLTDAGLKKTSVSVVLDLNDNGSADPNEPPLPFLVVCSGNGYDCAFTDPGGSAFIAFSSTGDTLLPGWLPFSTFSPAFHLIDKADSTYVFLVSRENHNDIAVSLNNNSAPRPGFESVYTLQFNNAGNTAQGLGVKLTLDPSLELQSATPPPDLLVNNTLSWYFNQLLPLSNGTISIRCKLPPGLSIGDTLLSIAETIPDSLDNHPDDNVDTLREIVVGSFDPNDKQVFPAGNITPSEVSEGKRLTYKIRFQNTGTYPAENVLITDTVAAELDIRTIVITASSHPCAATLAQGNVLQFYFGNIHLPDSNSNEAASHGFVEFSIEALKNLQAGALIRNQAYIYFDYNAPVITNTVQTEVKTTVSSTVPAFETTTLLVSPNPASDRINLEIDSPETGEGRLELWDVNGRRMYDMPFEKKVAGRSQYTISPPVMQSGIYIVACVWENGKTETSRVLWMR